MISRRIFIDASAVVLLLALGQVKPLSGQYCLPNGNCVFEYDASGSDGDCSYQYTQLYCDPGVYMDCSTVVCDTGSSIDIHVSCNCY